MESKNTHPKIELKAPGDFRLHPFKKLMPRAPEWQKGGASFNALCDDIVERGIVQPLLVTPADEILSGELCWLAAKQLKLIDVPVIVTSADPAGVILSGLVHRVHLTKGAQMWVAFDLFTPVWKAAQARRHANLIKNPNVIPIANSVGYRSASFGDYLKNLGFSDELYHQAKKLREIFERQTEPRSITSKDTGVTVHNTTFRDYYEPLILSGAVGLGAVIAGIGSSVKNAKEPQVQTSQGMLFLGGLDTITKRYSYWPEMSEEDKEKATTAIYRSVEAMPEELRDEFEKAIRAVKKSDGRKAA